jgi:hypothetical protein
LAGFAKTDKFEIHATKGLYRIEYGRNELCPSHLNVTVNNKFNINPLNNVGDAIWEWEKERDMASSQRA